MSVSSLQRPPKLKIKPSVLQKFLFLTPLWQQGFKLYRKFFGQPSAYVFFFAEDSNPYLLRLDRNGNAAELLSPDHNRFGDQEQFLLKYGEQIFHNDALQEKLPTFYKSSLGKPGAVFALQYAGKLKGILFLTPISRHEREAKEHLISFDLFLRSEMEVAYKTFEANNFYETVHPRALALSTMHSVHRVISSSLHLHELLPRIGRLSAQVLKCKGCSIMLVESNREYLAPSFYMGEPSVFLHQQRLKIGRGIEGRIAKTGEFHMTRRSIGLPFIEDDVVGVIMLWGRIDHQPFTHADLEILKSLSEQAVVAIKNAQLYEETEQLTLGSIKTINELLELNFGGDQMRLPVVGEIILEVGRELQLSSKELIHLSRAVLLIDTGALAFPEILRKKGKLTKSEYEQIKRIPLRGADILKSITSLRPALPIITHHRERFDGKGYPNGLKGQEIPIGARIVSVVDAFIAMISERVYRKPRSLSEAIHEIKLHSGSQFDPVVVDCFLRVIQRPAIMEKLKTLQPTTLKNK